MLCGGVLKISEFKKIVKRVVVKNKYNARKVIVDGIKFDSIKEGDYYLRLKILEKAGVIRNLILQPLYVFWHNKIQIGRYLTLNIIMSGICLNALWTLRVVSQGLHMRNLNLNAG